MLHNIQRLCPSFATCVLNYCRSDAELFVGGETLISAEGTTQGDPLSMAIYALGTVPLINGAQTEAMQVWFADDVSAADKLVNLRALWTILKDRGPSFGYYVNVPKTWLVVRVLARSCGFPIRRYGNPNSYRRKTSSGRTTGN